MWLCMIIPPLWHSRIIINQLEVIFEEHSEQDGKQTYN